MAQAYFQAVIAILQEVLEVRGLSAAAGPADFARDRWISTLSLRMLLLLSALCPPQGYDVHHYFFAEDEQHPHTPPDAFAFLAEPGLFGVQANVTFVGTMRPEPTVYHLMNADALVTTGSSFPIVAAVASWKPLLFLGRPKEGPYGVHALCDSVLLDDKGGLAEDSIAAVRTRAQAKYRQFHAGRVPPAGSSFSWTDVNSAALCPIDEVVAV